MFKKASKPGSAMTEIAVGSALAVVAVIVGLSLFNDNLSGMIVSSKLSNFFAGNNTKTQYPSFNRDYSNSQINVQIMGEQGLGMLRRIANNKAITQIGDAFSGADISTTNINSIGYLALAIKAIVGKPDICVYMQNDSDKFCSNEGIDGYSYKIDYSSSSVTIKKVDKTGDTVIETKVLTVGSELNGIISKVIPIGTNGRSSLSTTEKFVFIRDISKEAKSYVYKHVLLIDPFDTFTSTDKPKSISDLIPELTDELLPRLKNLISSAHEKCTVYFFVDLDFSNGGSGCSPLFNNMTGANSNFVSRREVNKFKNIIDEISNNINLSSSKDPTVILKLITESNNSKEMISIMRNDGKNSPTTCEQFKSSLENITEEYKVDINIPECSLNEKDKKEFHLL